MCFGSKPRKPYYDTATNGDYNPYGPRNKGPATAHVPKTKAGKFFGVDPGHLAPAHAGGVNPLPHGKAHPNPHSTNDYHQVHKHGYGKNPDELTFADGHGAHPPTPAARPMRSGAMKSSKSMKVDPRFLNGPTPGHRTNIPAAYPTPTFGSPIWNPAAKVPDIPQHRPSTAHSLKSAKSVKNFSRHHSLRDGGVSPMDPADRHRSFANTGPISPMTPHPALGRANTKKLSRGFSAPGRPSMPASLLSGVSPRNTMSAPGQFAHVGAQGANGGIRGSFKLHPPPKSSKGYKDKPLPPPPVPPKPAGYQAGLHRSGTRVASHAPQLPPMGTFAPLADIGKMKMRASSHGSSLASRKSVSSSHRPSMAISKRVRVGNVSRGHGTIKQAPRVTSMKAAVMVGGSVRRR